MRPHFASLLEQYHAYPAEARRDTVIMKACPTEIDTHMGYCWQPMPGEKTSGGSPYVVLWVVQHAFRNIVSLLEHGGVQRQSWSISSMSRYMIRRYSIDRIQITKPAQVVSDGRGRQKS